MATPSALSLSKYVIQRDLNSILSLSLDFMDESGTVVLVTKGKMLVTRQTIEEPNGNVLVTITHKVLSLMPTYEIHDGDVNGPITVIIKQNFNLGMFLGGRSININDASGQPIAVANGDFMGFQFNITSTDGAQVATVSKAIGPGIMQGITDLMKRKYVLSISDKGKIPTLSILGFLVVLEILATQHHGSSGGGGR
jgi:uncharacterized protein YxjI